MKFYRNQLVKLKNQISNDDLIEGDIPEVLKNAIGYIYIGEYRGREDEVVIGFNHFGKFIIKNNLVKAIDINELNQLCKTQQEKL